MRTLLAPNSRQTTNFRFRRYVDPAALEGPFYVGYVCLCFLYDAADKTDRTTGAADVTESRERACARRQVKEKEKKRKKNNRLAAAALSWPPHRRRFARRI